jgi:hypothetical protein
MFHPFSRSSTDARTLSNEQILIQVVLSLLVTPAVFFRLYRGQNNSWRHIVKLGDIFCSMPSISPP